jgi:hypothetical protein
MFPLALVLVIGSANCSRPQTVCDGAADTIPFEIEVESQLTKAQLALLDDRFAEGGDEGSPEPEVSASSHYFPKDRREWELRMIRENHLAEVGPLLAALDQRHDLPGQMRSQVHAASQHAHEHLYLTGLAAMERELRSTGDGGSGPVLDAFSKVCTPHHR